MPDRIVSSRSGKFRRTSAVRIFNLEGITMQQNNGMLILDPKMFDDGTLLYKNFCIATADDTMLCEFETIQREFAAHIPEILKNIDKGYIVVGSGADSFEIQWD